MGLLTFGRGAEHNALWRRAVQRSIVSPFSNGIEEFEGQRRTKDSLGRKSLNLCEATESFGGCLDIGESLVRLRVDQMRHVRRFRRIDEHFAIGAKTHSLGFDSDGNFGNLLACRDVDGGHHIVILVRNIKEPAVGTQDQQLGIRSRRQSAGDGKCPSIENLKDLEDAYEAWSPSS